MRVPKDYSDEWLVDTGGHINYISWLEILVEDLRAKLPKESPDLNIRRVRRCELGDLVDFIKGAKKITYQEAENMIPGVYFEGAHICDDQGDEEWCSEFVEMMIANGIDAIEIYQDC